ncbi:hypothetical protein I6F35_13635 [Bradyrhizobium sp. BRP22]|uniref:hypothetical protein n=1 Tax=Bradyrhizobium sp. BRP22 TaxID=2793821 RepID=UPI001CD4A1D4|nr:hypothetical protein [Bradyrhizobium sp. BRP22]MCA1454251.1 hypothetical protein [Bradyrhizobium sp. BRP22]
MVGCRSLPQMCLLGPVPPRTPGRSDAQVPSDAALGASRYARISYVYFYSEDDPDDVAFGLLDVEIAVQRRARDEFRLEIYCIGDGYQSGHGSSAAAPLIVELKAGDRTVARAHWRYPDVLNGHMDPLTLSTSVDLSEADFEALDHVYLPSVRAEAMICLE